MTLMVMFVQPSLHGRTWENLAIDAQNCLFLAWIWRDDYCAHLGVCSKRGRSSRSSGVEERAEK